MVVAAIVILVNHVVLALIVIVVIIVIVVAIIVIVTVTGNCKYQYINRSKQKYTFNGYQPAGEHPGRYTHAA